MTGPLFDQPFLAPDLSEPRFPKTSRYFGKELLVHTSADGTPMPYLERRFPPQPGRLETVGTYMAAAPDRRDLAAAVALGRAELWWQVADAAGASDPDLVVDQPGTPVRLAMDPEGTT
jgi:hypothetical protein